MDMGAHHMGAMAPAPPPSGGSGTCIHMTFYWGEGLADGGMYALAALVAVFALAFLLGFLGSRRLDPLLAAAVAAGTKTNGRAAVHALRMGGAYLLVHALMSFNGGVRLAAVAGHAPMRRGSWAFRAGLCGNERAQVENGCNKEKHAPASCC